MAVGSGNVPPELKQAWDQFYKDVMAVHLKSGAKITAILKTATKQTERVYFDSSKKATDIIRNNLRTASEYEETDLKRRMEILKRFTKASTDEERKWIGGKTRAMTVLRREEAKQEALRMGATSKLGYFQGALKMAGARGAEKLEGKIEDVFGLPAAGKVSEGLGKMAFWITLVIKILNRLGEVGEGYKATSALMINSGNALNLNMKSVEENYRSMNHQLAWMGVGGYDSAEALKLMSTAASEGGMTVGNFADTIGDVAKNTAGDRLRGLLTASVRLGKLGEAFGMTAEDMVKKAFIIRKGFGTATEDLPDIAAYIGAEANMFTMVGSQYIDLMASFAEQTKYTNMTIGTAINSVHNLFVAFQQTAKQMDSATEKAKMTGPQIMEIIRGMLSAFGQVSPAQMLAYSNKPITDYGESYVDALLATPIDKIAATFSKLGPMAEMTGNMSKKSEIGYLLNLSPQLQQMGQAGYLVAKMAQENKALIQSLQGRPQQEQVEALRKAGVDISNLSQELYIQANPAQALLAAFNNFSKIIISYVNDIATNKLTNLILGTDKTASTIKEVMGGDANANRAKGIPLSRAQR